MYERITYGKILMFPETGISVIKDDLSCNQKQLGIQWLIRF